MPLVSFVDSLSSSNISEQHITYLSKKNVKSSSKKELIVQVFVTGQYQQGDCGYWHNKQHRFTPSATIGSLCCSLSTFK